MAVSSLEYLNAMPTVNVLLLNANQDENSTRTSLPEDSVKITKGVAVGE